MRSNGASIYPSVMLERQDGALTSIGARIGILDEQHSTLQLKRTPHENAIHSAQALAKWIVRRPHRSATSRTGLISASPSASEHAGGDGEANGCSEAGCDEIMTADCQKNPT